MTSRPIPSPFRTLSIVIPCYREAMTLDDLVERVLSAPREGLALDLVIVDDASPDASYDIACALAVRHPEVRVIRHDRNRGKGAALRSGFAESKGDIVIIQDADLEYDPNEYPKLLRPILDGRADVVYGSRFRGGDVVRVLYFWHSLGNQFLTLLSNMVTDLNLTDMETCYKAFRKDILERIVLCEDRFGFEPEVTIKVGRLKPRPRIYEVGISYSGRTYEEGKKIGWKDGFRAIWCIVRYGFAA